MAYEYFISYRRKSGGENQARQVAEILSKYVGEDKVFYDRVSMREGNWRDQINDALNSAEHFVLLVNEASAAEDQSNNIGGYRYEIEYALNNEKKITLIEYDKKSYEEVIKEYQQLIYFQKVTFNGEYNFAFEERLCKHFGFAYHLVFPNLAKTNNNKYDPDAVYISYAHTDTDTVFVNNLNKIIRQSSIKCYIDKTMEYGEYITDFEEAIGKGRCVIIVFSEKYFKSRHCMYEFKNIQKGLEEHIQKLICFKSGECDLKDPKFIRDLHVYWWGIKGGFEYDKKSCKPLPIDEKANENGFYITDIKDLYSFFHKNLYACNYDIDYNKLIQEISSIITPLDNNKINDNDNLTEKELNKKLNDISKDLKIISKRLYDLATRKENIGDFKTSEIYYQKAIKIMRYLQDPQENSKDLINALNNFARLEEELSDLNSAQKHYQEALSTMIHLPETTENLSMYANALNNYALFETNIGSYDSAIKHYEEAVEIGRKLPETPKYLFNLANTLCNLAGLEKNLDETDSAKKHLEETIEIFKKLPETPDYLDSLSSAINNLALLEKKLGDTNSAKKHCEEAVEVNRKLLKLAETPKYLDRLANSLSNLAGLEDNLGDAASAKKHFEEAAEIYRQLPETPKYLDNLTDSLAGLATVEVKLGDINSAKMHLEEGLEVSRRSGNEEDIKFFERRLSSL